MVSKKQLCRVHFSPDRLEKSRKAEGTPKYALSIELCGNPNRYYQLLKQGWTCSPRLAFGLLKRYGKTVLATRAEVSRRAEVDFDSMREVLEV